MLPINRFPTATAKVTSTTIPTNAADPAVTANPTANEKAPVTTSNVPTTKVYTDATTPRTSLPASNVGTSAAPGTAGAPGTSGVPGSTASPNAREAVIANLEVLISGDPTSLITNLKSAFEQWKSKLLDKMNNSNTKVDNQQEVKDAISKTKEAITKFESKIKDAAKNFEEAKKNPDLLPGLVFEEDYVKNLSKYKQQLYYEKLDRHRKAQDELELAQDKYDNLANIGFEAIKQMQNADIRIDVSFVFNY